MKLFLYSVHDSASGIYDRPFAMQSDAAAIRGFKDACEDAESFIGKHPEDFTLVQVGTWDDNLGKIVGENPRKVTNGLEQIAALRQIRKDQLEMFQQELDHNAPKLTEIAALNGDKPDAKQ